MSFLDGAAIVAPPAASPAGPPTGLLENLGAAYDSFQAFGNTAAKRNYETEAYDPVLAHLAATGAKVREPGVFGIGAWDRPFRNPGANQVAATDPAGAGFGYRRDDTAAIWAHAATDPGWPAGLPRTKAAFDAEVAKRRNADLAKAGDVAARASGIGGAVGGFVGGLGAGFTDPLILSTLPFGGGEAAAVGFARNLLLSTGRNAVIAAGVTAATQPLAAADAASLGIDYGLGDAAKAVGGAALTGGAFGAVHVAIPAAVRAVAPAVADAARFVGRAGTRALAKSVDLATAPLAARDAAVVLHAAADAAELSPFHDTPEGDANHATRLGAAVEALHHGEPLPVVPPPPPGLIDSAKAAPPAVTLARGFDPATLDARLRAAPNLQTDPARPPVFGITVDPRDVGVDAATMQFKAGGDEAGVTDRLGTVKTWDRVLAGRTLVWQDEAGKLWIADGHQRHGLATRILGRDPAADVAMDAALYRASDGVTAADMGVIAARKNLAEGTGSAVDAAKIFRDDPTAADNLPAGRDSVVAAGRDLAKLSDDAFGMVVNGHADEAAAALVGRLLPDRPAEHASVLSAIGAADLSNLGQVEKFIRLAKDAPVAHEVQHGLFGAETLTANLVAEKARLLDGATKRIVGDRRLFQGLVDRQSRIEAAGNALDTAANSERATNAATLNTALERLAYRPGPVADALGAAARGYAERGRTAAGFRAALDEFFAALPPVGDLIRDGGDGAASVADTPNRPGGAAEGAVRDGGPRGADGHGGDAAEEDGALAGEPDATARDAGPERAADGAARPQLDAFADPHDGAGAKAQVASVEHDLYAADPNLKARERQETQLRADAPVRATVAQSDLADTGLFGQTDLVDRLFALDDGGATAKPGDLLARLDDDDAAIVRIEACL